MRMARQTADFRSVTWPSSHLPRVGRLLTRQRPGPRGPEISLMYWLIPMFVGGIVELNVDYFRRTAE